MGTRMGSEADNACKTSLGGWALGLLALGYSGTWASQNSIHIQTKPKGESSDAGC